MKMRRLLGLFVLACTVPALFSCTKEPVSSPVEETRELVIRASREGEEPETKTQVVSGKTYWSVADEISVFFGAGTEGGAKFTSTNTEPSASADFSGILTAVTGSSEGVSQKYFWGVYPYNAQNSLTLSGSSNVLTTVVPNIQYGVAGSFSEGQNISVGRSLGLEMSFYNLLSGLKVSFSRSDITKITIQGNNGEYIAGRVHVTMDSGVPEVESVVAGQTVITLTPEFRDTFVAGEYYQVLFLPTNFTKGLTMTLYAADGSVGKRSFKANNYERNKPKTATNADANATFVSPQYVDMGNGLKMATWNVGASSPEQTGEYFAWGETATKTNYDWATYKWGSSASTLTKYVTNSTYGTCDYQQFLTAADDAATKNWGPSWRTPTDLEWNTLLDTSKYTWTWTANYNSTGVAGYTVTSKSTNNSIFLPAAGYYSSGRPINKTQGYYLSSTASDSNDKAIELVFSSSSHAISGGNLSDCRMRGKSVRPIYAPRKPVESIVMEAYESTLVDNGKPKNTYALLQPADAFDRGLHIYTTNPSVIEVDASLHNYIMVDPEGSKIPLTIHGPGTTEMIFETPDHSVQATMIINVESTATGITLNKTSHTFLGFPEDSQMAPIQLTATVTPSTAGDIVYWRSSDESVATVDYDGKVTPVGSGTATISAMKGSVTATCNVTVDLWEHVTGVAFYQQNGQPKEFHEFGVTGLWQQGVVVTPSTAKIQTVQWMTSDASVVSFRDGYIVANKPGIAIISAVSQDPYVNISADAVVMVYTSSYDGRKYVDIGNGYKIAAANIGAEHAWEYGSYFKWADPRPTAGSSPWPVYKYFGSWEKQGYPDSQSSMWLPRMTKYVASPASAFNYPNSSIDGKTVLEPADDPASALWGSYWRSPTGLEWQAILEICTVEERSVLGVKGAMLKSQINGAAVFIPYGGYDKDNMGYMLEKGQSAYLWGSTIGTSPNGSLTGHPEWADYVKISGSDSSSSKGTKARRCALNVRAIHKD